MSMQWSKKLYIAGDFNIDLLKIDIIIIKKN